MTREPGSARAMTRVPRKPAASEGPRPGQPGPREPEAARDSEGPREPEPPGLAGAVPLQGARLPAETKEPRQPDARPARSASSGLPPRPALPAGRPGAEWESKPGRPREKTPEREPPEPETPSPPESTPDSGKTPLPRPPPEPRGSLPEPRPRECPWSLVSGFWLLGHCSAMHRACSSISRVFPCLFRGRHLPFSPLFPSGSARPDGQRASARRSGRPRTDARASRVCGRSRRRHAPGARQGRRSGARPRRGSRPLRTRQAMRAGAPRAVCPAGAVRTAPP